MILLAHFKIRPGMLADRAELGRLRANDRMTAVAALPHGDAALFKDLHGLHILQQCAIALLVRLFDGGMEPIPGGIARLAQSLELYIDLMVCCKGSGTSVRMGRTIPSDVRRSNAGASACRGRSY